MFSKENFKVPFWGSILIVIGVLHRGFTTDHISGLILSSIGGIMILYAIYLMYKKTGLIYGSIAAAIYITIVIFYLILGFSFVFLIFAVILLSARRNDNYYNKYF